MERDDRYLAVNMLVKRKTITTFAGIFKYVPKTTMARYLGTNNNRMTRLINKPNGFTLEEIERIAFYFELSVIELVELMYKEKD